MRNVVEVRVSPRRYLVLQKASRSAPLDSTWADEWLQALDLDAYREVQPGAVAVTGALDTSGLPQEARVEEAVLPSELAAALPKASSLGLEPWQHATPRSKVLRRWGRMSGAALVTSAGLAVDKGGHQRPPGPWLPYALDLIVDPEFKALRGFAWTPTRIGGRDALVASTPPICCTEDDAEYDSMMVVFAGTDRFALASGADGPAMRRLLEKVDWRAFREAAASPVMVDADGLYRGVTYADGLATLWTGESSSPSGQLPDPLWPRPLTFALPADWSATSSMPGDCSATHSGRLALLSSEPSPPCPSGTELLALARQRPIVELYAVSTLGASPEPPSFEPGSGAPTWAFGLDIDSREPTPNGALFHLTGEGTEATVLVVAVDGWRIAVSGLSGPRRSNEVRQAMRRVAESLRLARPLLERGTNRERPAGLTGPERGVEQ